MFPRLIATIARNSYKSELKRLGAKVEFSKLPKGFVHGFIGGDLTSIWRDQGLPVHGIGIFTVGETAEEGRSTRYVPESLAYQAWFGCYLIDAPDDFLELDKGVPNLNNIFQLAIEDQNSWLRRIGDPNPVTFPMPGTENVQNDVPLQEGTGTLVEVKLKTHTDLGPDGKKPGIFIRTLRHLFFSDEELNLPKDFLIAPDSDKPYRPLVLHGFVLITKDDETGVTAVGFACGTESHFSKMRNELLDSLLSLKIIKDES